MTDIALTLLIALLSLGMTVMGGILASKHPWVRAGFVLMGVASLVLLALQAVRSSAQQREMSDKLNDAIVETKAAHRDTRQARAEAVKEREESRREREESRQEREAARQARADERTAEKKLQAQIDKTARATAQSVETTVGKFASDTSNAVGRLLQAPRSLTVDQRERLAALLRVGAPASIAIRHTTGDLESQKYADEFAEVFKTAGWQLTSPLFAIMEHEGEGLVIFVSDMAKAPPRAILLQKALAEAGIDAPGIASPHLANTADAVELFVGLQAKKVR